MWRRFQFFVSALLGRADGAAKKCPICAGFFSKGNGEWGPGVGECCSEQCADEAQSRAAW